MPNFSEKREYDVENNYTIHKNITNQFFGNVSEYIKSKCFHKCTPYRIYENNFPYIHSYKKHLVFWINPLYEKFYNIERVRDICKQLYGNFNHNVFRNPENDRSVKDVYHYQLFIFDQIFEE